MHSASSTRHVEAHDHHVFNAVLGSEEFYCVIVLETTVLTHHIWSFVTCHQTAKHGATRVCTDMRD